MSERDDLAAVIAQLTAENTSLDHLQLAAGILSAGYRKHRIITTQNELESLPEGSVGVAAEGEGWIRGLGRPGKAPSTFFPAVVLHLGEDRS